MPRRRLAKHLATLEEAEATLLAAHRLHIATEAQVAAVRKAHMDLAAALKHALLVYHPHSPLLWDF
jgi:hypothetical protein